MSPRLNKDTAELFKAENTLYYSKYVTPPEVVAAFELVIAVVKLVPISDVNKDNEAEFFLHCLACLLSAAIIWCKRTI